ncbi:MAG: cell division topological specificity factor MinE [Anaerolineae bacterium]|jgi:cell division topological specificity factor|nr:cell division topological specificity factor MinE [Anaerolineae bacterium]MBT7074923.1 cell division topological specificity factor MinE [Anaerolineae bacterium]MBT7782114.1 cell division topological specificity factor MinE [Anaerolineae bacterium]
MSLFKSVFNNEKKSAQSAKERLQLVLTHDRTDITPAQLEALKDELIEVISRHISIEPAAVNINVAREGREQRLVADIPLKVAQRRGK